MKYERRRTMDDPENTLAAQRRYATRGMPSVEIEMGLAYEFLESLLVYYAHGWHENTCEYEVSEAWFEHIRTSCPKTLLEGLDGFTLQAHSARGWLHSWSHLLGLAYDSPPPKDVATFMSYLGRLSHGRSVCIGLATISAICARSRRWT